MKQKSLLNLLFIICVSFISCSKDDASNDNPEGKQILIKNVSEEIYNNGQVEKSSTNFIYENNILKNISKGTYVSELIYNGEKIVRINNYVNNVLSAGYTSFQYDGDLLKYTLSGEKQDNKTVYSYINSVLTTQKSGLLNGVDLMVSETKNYSFNTNMNIAETLSSSNTGGKIYDSKKKSVYDTKNNPMKFMNKYFKIIYKCEGFDGLSKNNEISFDSFFPISSTTPAKTRFEIIYNADDFPIEIKKYSVLNNVLISKTNIEYQ
ncbi:hypothetical protein [Flavobacterium aestivum]|uniref:hypothetical protein n=1 Tax=Flavobacterium aestivum TaxID=3003257 RepID=UPI00228685BB|nr:hypothetical protein [Flavobacterium aestivum]